MFPSSDPFLEFFLEGVMNFYNSPYMLAIKIFMGIYTMILIANIMMLLKMRGIAGNIRAGLRGSDIPLVTPKGMQKRWKKIMSRFDSGNSSQFKVAIIEADAAVNEILSGIGYEGANMAEKLEHVKPEQLDNLDDLKAAHQIRNRVIHEDGFALDKEAALEVIRVYEDILKYFEYL